MSLAGAVDVPVEIIGGLVCDMAPSELPAGVSPDCADVIFAESSVRTRPGLGSPYATLGQPFGAPFVTYLKTFITSSGTLRAMALDSGATLWKEASPGSFSLVQSVADAIVSGNIPYANSTTLFGREFIALSDGQNGTGLPRQYDDTNLDRVSQSGPGAAPVVTDETFQLTIDAGAGSASMLTAKPITAITQAGNIVTVSTTGEAIWPFTTGEMVVISGSPVPGYNGTFPVLQNIGGGFTYVLPNTGLPSAPGGGTAQSQAAKFLTDSSYGIRSNYPNGMSVTISGVGVSGYNVTGVVVGNATWTNGGLVDFGIIVNIGTVGLANSSGGHIVVTGNIVAGVHMCSVVFVTRNQFITAPAPPFTWTAAGGRRALVGNIPTGPANVIQRILIFTPAASSHFYYLTGVPQINNSNFVIPDNVTTSLTVDFSDQILQAGTLSDYLFNQVILGECAGVIDYSQRLFWWGERNKVQNFVNMDFDGGWSPVVPTVTTYPLFSAQGQFNFVQWLTSGTGGAAVPPVGATIVVTGAVNPHFNGTFTVITSSPSASAFTTALVAPIFTGDSTGSGGTITFTSPIAAPLGWTPKFGVFNEGGRAQFPNAVNGDAYSITYTAGSGTVTGQIQQGAYQDWRGVTILQSNTQYSVRIRLSNSGSGVAVPNTFIVVDVFSPSTSVQLGQFAVLCTGISTTFTEFSGVLFSPQVNIPTDAILRLYLFGVCTTSYTVLVDCIEIYPTTTPFNASLVRASRAQNQESYDGVTGLLLPVANNGQAVRSAFRLRERLYFVKERSLYVTQDDYANEPAQWTISEVSPRVGTPSVRGVGLGEDWAVIAAREGLYITRGGEPVKISQEVGHSASGFTLAWDQINWKYGFTLWVVVDTNEKRIYIGAPFGAATSPNAVMVLDYRDIDSEQGIEQSPPIRVSYRGIKVVSDKSRKWSPWNVAMMSAALIERTDGTAHLWMGQGSGNAPAADAGAIYDVQAANLSDYSTQAQIPGYYTTSFVPQREANQAAQMDEHRKLFTYMTMYVEGSGRLNINAFPDSQSFNIPLPSLYLLSPAQFDTETNTNVLAERIAFKFAPIGTAAWFRLQKLSLSVKSDPWAPVRGL